MGKWADGKVVSNKSWALLKDNTYLLGFPVIGFALAFVPLVVFGGGAAYLLGQDNTPLAIILGIVGLILVSFAFSLSNGAIVAAVDEELAGNDSSISHGFGRAFGRMGALFGWALIEAAVSLIIGLIRGKGQGGAADLPRHFLAGIGAAAWSVISLFVTPFIMLKDLGAIAALKSSVQMVKEKWGTQVTGGIRIGVQLLILIIPSIALIVVGALLLFNGGPLVTLGVGLLAVGILLAILWGLISNAIRAVFAVALFHFTTGEGSVGPFTPGELHGVLTRK